MNKKKLFLKSAQYSQYSPVMKSFSGNIAKFLKTHFQENLWTAASE